jgi:hypothetical protein
VVFERESPHQTTAHAKRVRVTMLSADGRWHRREVATGAFEKEGVTIARPGRPARELLTIVAPTCAWKITWRVECLWTTVLDRDAPGNGSLPIEEPGKSGQL